MEYVSDTTENRSAEDKHREKEQLRGNCFRSVTTTFQTAHVSCRLQSLCAAHVKNKLPQSPVPSKSLYIHSCYHTLKLPRLLLFLHTIQTREEHKLVLLLRYIESKKKNNKSAECACI